MSALRWRIRYGDGVVLDNTVCTPQSVPGKNVQTIVQWGPRGREILQGFALYYWMEDLGLWWGGDVLGFLELAEHDAHVKYPKRGLNCRDFQAILDATVADPDFDPGLRGETA
jgi:hypothetical protein